ncbi:fatty acid hydroxylase family protein [Leptospira fluminis]|uniref:Fatty acid hydroxylase family protein n=1 Tax=Leptospira fluminis TaxID=2484979 RepID=A0A4R9GRR8_9LEPT|nr:sterol desaturase family protein [Leptospira fluminis]TGK19307.1 fatty acid hydroxylase family protein [Leptospira fluminis]
MPSCQFSLECVESFALFQLSMNFLRYYPLAGLVFLVFWIWKKGSFQKFRIQQSFPKSEKIWSEIKQSAVTLFMFSGIAISVYILSGFGILNRKIYFNLSEHGGWAYGFFSLFLITVWHETWFYWFHRLMHHRKVYSLVHSLHHKSVNPSPFAAYNFHWIEAFLEAFYVVPFICLVPFHFGFFLAHTVYAMVMNIWWHTGYELFPRGWAKHPILKWINTSTHHNMHHQRFHGNYSLYFNFWDRVMKTNFEDYETTFETVAKGRGEERNADRNSRGDLVDSLAFALEER